MVAKRLSSVRSLSTSLVCLAVACAVWIACDDPARPAAGPQSRPDPAAALPEEYAHYPRTAALPTVLQLRDDLAAVRHPSDGGGRAWLEDGPTEVRISSRHTWTIVYEAGALGISEGGVLYFMTSPFWGWEDPPQTGYPEAPGYTKLSTTAEGVTLESLPFGKQLLGIAIGGRELRSGERVTIEYGVGAGAISDRYYERDASFWIAVDGDGDGVRKLVDEQPMIDVVSGPPSGLWLTVPTTARIGEPARVTLALLDARGNAWVDWKGAVEFVDVPDGVTFPDGTRVELGPGAEAAATARIEVATDGLYTLHARLDPPLVGTPDDFSYESNPMHVSEAPLQIFWADFHGHSQLSDGTGTPEDYYRYARDVAALDIAALTDHDHWGVRFIDQNPDMWQRIGDVTQSFHDPGRFVTLLGYEWTSWIYGHRHVLYFTDEGELHSSVDPATETPQQLWDALRGQDVLTFAHHSAGGPIGTDWSFVPDPLVEPVTEVMSVHGSSEAADSPQSIYRPIPGNFVRDQLDRGLRFGFIGSGDSHDGHPGLAHLASPAGGLAAILAEDLTRESVLEALRARRVYATSGARILLRASLGGHRMGSTLPAEEAGLLELRVHVVGTGPIASFDVVSGGQVTSLDCQGAREFLPPPFEIELASGDYLYLRIVQEDKSIAWSSPFYVE